MLVQLPCVGTYTSTALRYHWRLPLVLLQPPEPVKTKTPNCQVPGTGCSAWRAGAEPPPWPHLVEAAWDGINLDPQGRHCPGVDDVTAGDQQAHQAVGGQHKALITVQKAQLAGLNI